VGIYYLKYIFLFLNLNYTQINLNKGMGIF
jgi:hypothetical protein